MKSHVLGLRVALFGLLTLVLVGGMVAAGESRALGPLEVLAAEKLGAPVMMKTGLAAVERVSPFFATPALDALRMETRAAWDDCAQYFQLQNNSDTEWWIYTMGVWYCIADQVYPASVSWNWVLLESDGTTPLVSCGTVWDWSTFPDPYIWPYGGGCAVNYYDYFDYECVGDEQFVVSFKPYGQNWVGPQFNFSGPEYGCAQD